ncbi:MAG: hypothetical protein KDI11_07305 [Alphaproteobacteria bacterium]|nr:hypothetical protein [Alphaproteobacteria bacterium]
MNETRFPVGPSAPGQSPRAAPGNEPNARLIGVPNEVRAELHTRRTSIRIQGEVVRHNDDGSIRVRTERGDVDVRLREGQPKPERGAPVEIEIPPAKADGRPPENATVRELPREPAHKDTATPRADSTPSARTSTTPVDVQVREKGEAPTLRIPLPADVRHGQNAAGKTAQVLPPIGTAVRLQPLPARAAQSLPALPDLIEQAVQTVIQPAVFQTQIIAQQAQIEIAQEVLSIQRPAGPPPLPILETVIPNASAPAIETQKTPLPALITTASSFPAILTQEALPQNVALVVPETDSAPTPTPAPVQTRVLSTPFSPAPTITLPLPIADFVSSPLPVSTITAPTRVQPLQPLVPVPVKPQALDVVIVKILPPDVQILSDSLGVEAPAPGTLQVTKPEIKPEMLITHNQNAGNLVGVVTAVTPDTLPVISVFFPQLGNEQLFTLQFPSESVMIGTQIQVTPHVSPSSAQPLAAPALPQEIPLPAFLTPQPWPALDEALQVLARAAPQTAQAMVNVTPSPSAPAQLGPAIMFFVAALRGGDLGSWLGDKATNVLKSQKGGQSLSRLMGDGAAMTRIAREPMGQDWRALNIPLYYEGDMHKIGLHYKHERDEQEDGKSSLKGMRFVFDLALDAMGKVQLDGLFRPVSDMGKRLDLVVRTQEHFSEATRAEMRRVYARALRDSGVSGELSFQGATESWVTIMVDQSNALGVNA